MLTPRSLLVAVVVVVTAVFLTTGHPARKQREAETVRRQARPTGRQLLVDAQIGNVLTTTPSGARLIATKPTIPAILDRLPDNATLIRPNIVDTFTCDSKVYGYYADVDNECQVFHVCVPLQQLYPQNFTSEITYQFSFICPEFTIFSQDAMVCAWSTEAVPCEYAPDLYWMNQNFFREVQDGDIVRYAELNEPVE